MQKPIRESGLKRFWSAVRSSNSSSSSQCEQGGLGDSSPTEETKPGPNCSLPLLQVSPSPVACNSTASPIPSPTPSARRPSSSLLHPDHARIFRLYPSSSSPEQTSIEDMTDFHNGHASPSSSTTSSLTSVAAAVTAIGSRASDPTDSRRRSSTMTARYSLFDALDLEYALLRAAARGSVGPYSLSESLHKLTFTQSLAFPALARGLASKRRRSQQNNNSRPLDPNESGLNAFAKVVTALVLVLVSVLVFAVVYKFVRT
ncbi:PREDICTED: uncharacterized protein LOC108557955 isoform X2 [Nicrophorus vespilloides]|uniref:Uncharacterized protein LOC108557955 isoform X2 n=1 Tax=Nicrophorus vespilloides TaxID=110193 RepID=A0ABM1M6J5_NICVS|nr:PREDICTED: uncharacterized protein LOC108557955 isoform X2 [Nicrophorus vespilloides]